MDPSDANSLNILAARKKGILFCTCIYKRMFHVEVEEYSSLLRVCIRPVVDHFSVPRPVVDYKDYALGQVVVENSTLLSAGVGGNEALPSYRSHQLARG